MRYLYLIVLIITVQLAFVSCSNTESSNEVEKQEKTDYSNAFLLDVRTPQEHGIESVEGSVNIPINELQDNLDKLPQDNLIIVYCASGNRASSAIEMLESEGFTNLKNGINSSQVRELLKQ